MSKLTNHPLGEFLLYETEDGKSRVECRFQDETLWLSQALMAELFDRDVRTINEHLKNLYEEQELFTEATIRKFWIVRLEGAREVSREIEHYNLEAILAVGFRVKSPRGTQFRRWANTRLQEYLVKGFTMSKFTELRCIISTSAGLCRLEGAFNLWVAYFTSVRSSQLSHNTKESVKESCNRLLNLAKKVSAYPPSLSTMLNSGGFFYV